ncbi:response regulator transcription factor [Intrasporangium calvum]|uniref:Response regulator transcription factor n=1 Tax=Intrasporangium calvum TaxID=53358 RepID=A0ABT5GID9_9MICO|nr:response regulator transcription factor [Intrasporangium calvum]MDC5698022.1 response regulator transcription factor [Intrasporangium calvum]
MSESPGQSRPIRVMLVDDDPVVRMGVRHMLSVAPDIEVVAEVSDGDEVIGGVQAHGPDVLVLDVRMARVGGLEAIRALKARPEAPKILMFTVWDQDDVAGRAIEAGADGFLLKTASPEEIRSGIRNVAAGLGAVSPKTAAQLFTMVRSDSMSAQRADAARLVASLTVRERDVVAGLARGLSNAELARELFVSETTVKTHLASAFAKLGVDNRARAAILADRAGLL